MKADILGKMVYCLEDNDLPVEYRIIRVNQKSIVVQSTTNQNREFKIHNDEFINDWYFTIADCLRDALEKIDIEIDELRAPIQSQIETLQRRKRKIAMRLGNVS